MREEWRLVAGWKGRYEVSSLGNVRSRPHTRRHKSKLGHYYETKWEGGLLRPGLASNGYLTVCLQCDGERRSVPVQHLVAKAFIGPRPDGMYVLHDNGIRTDNRAENLRYGTPSENMHDKTRHGRVQLTPETVRAVRRAFAEGKTGPQIERELGVNYRQAYYIRDGVQYASVE